MARLSPAAGALAPSIIREMSARRRSSTLDLTLGQPARAPDQDLLERALDAYRAGPPGYTENAGLFELREAIARHHRRQGPEEVVVTVGSEQAVYLALTASVSPGDAVLVPEPGYPAYPGIVRLLGATPVSYPIRRATGLVPCVEDLEAGAPTETTVLLLNGPSNPFGTAPDRPRVEALLDLVARRNWTVISDEIYRDLWYPAAPFEAPSDLSAEVLLVSGLSKSCALTGFRLGYLAGPAPFIKQATLAHQLMVTCAPRLSQLVALEVFCAPERLRAHLPMYREAREALERTASALPEPSQLRLGSGAFYATLDVEAWAEAGTLALALELLEEEDVAVVPGIAFGPSGDWFFRLSYAGGAEVAEEGLRRIARFLRRGLPRGGRG